MASTGMSGGGITRSTKVSEGGSIVSDGGRVLGEQPSKGGIGKDPKQNVEAGSGSRPTRSMYPIETSMTGIDPKTLGRDVPGSLK
ncbi:MAG TPA: hypothetical protein VGR45_02630 [Stellaceae bacterium]|nr:hypothetical protein [Stellaceae bacterium]